MRGFHYQAPPHYYLHDPDTPRHMAAAHGHMVNSGPHGHMVDGYAPMNMSQGAVNSPRFHGVCPPHLQVSKNCDILSCLLKTYLLLFSFLNNKNYLILHKKCLLFNSYYKEVMCTKRDIMCMINTSANDFSAA